MFKLFNHIAGIKAADGLEAHVALRVDDDGDSCEVVNPFVVDPIVEIYLASIGAALRLVYPETELELHTPIGSKLVFEKWSDGTKEYVAINLVYQSDSQLQNRTLLSWMDADGLQTPMVLPVTIDGLTANDDGLYSMTDLDARIAEAMAEYDAIEDIPTIRK